MIKGKKDLEAYMRQDCIRNTGRPSINSLLMAVHCFYGNDSFRAFRYMKALRKYEYTLNCSKGFLGRIKTAWRKLKWHRLGAKYGICIKPNIVGPGLRMPHLVGGVILNCKKVGRNCTANAGVVVGNNNKGGMAVIGDNVDLCVGCKVIGGITVGDNVIIAPNSVVVKDVHDNAVVSGIPAQVLKYQE